MKLATAIVIGVTLLAGALWWVAQMAPGAALSVDNPRVRLVPGGAPMAGYMELGNHTAGEIRLIGARARGFARVMLHRSVIVDGQARMRPQDSGVTIAPGETVAFEPGGLHLMLIQPEADLAVGDPVDVVLRFDGLTPPEWPVTFTVVPVTAR